MKIGLTLAAWAALAALGGCSVGSGSGSITGPLFVVNCDKGANLGTAAPATGGYGIAPAPV